MAPRSGFERVVLADEVVIGVADGADSVPDVDPEECDVLLTGTPDPPRPWVAAPLDAVRAGVDGAPAAAVALVQVLRATERLAVPAAIVVESLAYSVLQHGQAFERWLATRAPAGAPAAPARPDPVGEPVRLERQGGRLVITLDRPEVHNALSAPMRDALCEAFDLVAADPDLVDVQLVGAGPSFSSGGDLHEFGTARDAAAAHRIRVARSVGRRVHAHAERVTAHLHGACVGAGIEIPAFAGRVVATADTVIRLPELAFGLIPGAGGTVSIPRRIGRHRTAYLVLSGAALDAATAQAWGLVDAVAEPDRR